jgi:hypothetical protein
VQTFLPYPDFRMSAQALDYRRLGKQRVECKQLLKALGYEIKNHKLVHCTQGGWLNHPCTQMWRGYELALAEYQADCIREWEARGYNNTMERVVIPDDVDLQYPNWLGDKAFHASHRSNLLRKDPDWYGRHGWKDRHDLPYVWPRSDHS